MCNSLNLQANFLPKKKLRFWPDLSKPLKCPWTCNTEAKFRKHERDHERMEIEKIEALRAAEQAKYEGENSNESVDPFEVETEIVEPRFDIDDE